MKNDLLRKFGFLIAIVLFFNNLNAQNIIPNPGFELGTADDFTNWTKQNGVANLVATTTNQRTGSRALQANVTGTQSNAGEPWSVQMLSSSFATTIGTTYTFKVWVKAATAGSNLIRFEFNPYPDPNDEYSGDYNLTTDWTQLSWTFVANSTSTIFGLDLGKSANTYYLDDMELTAANSAISADLLNPSFELGTGDVFTNWTKTNGASYLTATSVAAEVHSGTRALKSAGPGNAGEQWRVQMLSDAIATTIGTDYTFKIWVKAATAGGTIRFSTQPAPENYGPDTAVPAGVWTQLSWTFNAKVANTQIALDLGQSNVIYYLDDMQLTSPPLAVANCLNLNGGFELGTSDVFTNWNKFGGAAGLTATTSAGEFKSGTRALKAITSGGAEYLVQMVTDEISTKVGVNYKFTIYAKALTAGSTIRFSTKPDGTAKYSADFNVGTDWTLLSWTFNANEPLTRVSLDLNKNANTYYIDDACLEIICDGSFAPLASQTPIATGKTKFLGNVWSAAQVPNSNKYFNQVTPENAGKWGSVETADQVFNWTDLDAARKYASDNGFPFRFHVLLWGAQQPTWLKPMTNDQKITQIKQWFTAVKDRYNAASGAFKKPEYIEVLNEILNDPPNNLNNATDEFQFRSNNTTDNGSGDYVNALKTLNIQYGTTPGNYDWIVNAFKLAREIFGCDSKLMINEYGIESTAAVMNSYLEIIDLLKADNLVDAVGMQTHTFSTQLYNAYTPTNIAANTANLKTQLNALAAKNLPVMVTELDIDGDVSINASGVRVTTGTQAEKDAFQKSEFERIFPIYWDHPSVIGVTLWGYRTGHWRSNNAAYIMDICSGAPRPAMDYLNTTIRASNPTVGSLSALICPNNSISGKITYGGANSPNLLSGNVFNGTANTLYVKLSQNGAIKHIAKVSETGLFTMFKVKDGVYDLTLSKTFDNDINTTALPTGLSFGLEGLSDGTNATGDNNPDGKLKINVLNGNVILEIPITSRVAAPHYDTGNIVFALAGAPLPIDLISFEGNQIGETIALNWKTANEKGFSHFEVQKSENLKEFNSIGQIKGTSINFYNFVDQNPNIGLNYYRLKMVDLDGSFEFSTIKSVDFRKDNEYLEVQNPVENGEINVFSNAEIIKFELFTTIGKAVDIQVNKKDTNQYSIKINNLNSGIYFLKTISKNGFKTRKLLVK